MKALIIGANGQLGWELCRGAARRGFDFVPLDLPMFDMTNPVQVKEAVGTPGLSLVINAAAYTLVDKAESEPEQAYAVNRDGPAYLASACAETKIPLIHISTDYVFDGTKGSPYDETDPLAPVSVYGRSKAAGETEVESRLREHIILRTSWLYGIHGHNFVKTMLKLGKERERLRVVNDQQGCPTYAADLAETVVKVAAFIRDGHDHQWGTYHCCGRGAATWHCFAEKIFEIAGRHGSLMVEEVIPIPTAEYPTPAKRPANSVLACTKIEKAFGIQSPPWEESLARMIKELENKA